MKQNIVHKQNSEIIPCRVSDFSKEMPAVFQKNPDLRSLYKHAQQYQIHNQKIANIFSPNTQDSCSDDDEDIFNWVAPSNQKVTENVDSSSSDHFEEVKKEITAYNEMIEVPH